MDTFHEMYTACDEMEKSLIIKDLQSFFLSKEENASGESGGAAAVDENA